MLSMPTARIIDLSHHNSIPQDLLPARQAGIIGLIHKLTEGDGYVDDKCQARNYLAKQAGMLWGVYHFLRPGNMHKQADFFVSKAHQLDVIDNDTVLVADHEDEDVPAQDLKLFLDIVEDMTARSPVVYSGHVLKEQLAGSGARPKRRLWLCHYTSGTPTLPEGVDQYWLWQYTDKGKVPGITPPTDLNHFDGDEQEFRSSWSGYHGGGAPVPIEPTDRPTITVTVDADRPVNVRFEIGDNITSTEEDDT